MFHLTNNINKLKNKMIKLKYKINKRRKINN